jgi:small acid-soluble spore protein H (minor)
MDFLSISRIKTHNLQIVIENLYRGVDRMNVGRAKEIVESVDMVNVTYDGTPVIIQHVDETTKMARIYSRKNPEDERDVPVLNLIEDV